MDIQSEPWKQTHWLTYKFKRLYWSGGPGMRGLVLGHVAYRHSFVTELPFTHSVTLANAHNFFRISVSLSIVSMRVRYYAWDCGEEGCQV